MVESLKMEDTWKSWINVKKDNSRLVWEEGGNFIFIQVQVLLRLIISNQWGIWIVVSINSLSDLEFLVEEH